jgi:hypothetical protein
MTDEAVLLAAVRDSVRVGTGDLGLGLALSSLAGED